MANPFVGEIMLFGGTFAPVGWFNCDGSLYSIADYSNLFALIGTTYGGDGNTSFAVPDLRGRVPVHQGVSPSGSTYNLGEMGGVESVTLTTSQLPQHNHPLTANGSLGNAAMPAPGDYLSSMGPASTTQVTSYAAPGGPQLVLAGASIGMEGGNQSHDNFQPSLGFRYIIAWQGMYPSPN